MSGCAPADLPAELVTVDIVRTHVGDDARWASVDWNDAEWAQSHWAAVGSYDRILWLRARIVSSNLPREGSTNVAVAAAGAHEVYWNGALIGGSGRPGRSRDEEAIGPMSSLSSVPSEAIVAGENVLAIRLSSFRLPGRLTNTVHFLYVGPDRAPLQTMLLRSYVPGIAASGALFMGACYFAGLFLIDRRDRAAGFLALMSLAVLGQFCAEVYRAFVNYDYPLHVVRLWVVLAMACCYGLALVAYVSERCKRWRLGHTLVGTALAMALAIALVPGYDGKTHACIVIAAAVAIGLLLRAKVKRLLILVVPVALILWSMLSPWRFLDQHVYVATVAGILLLFFEQARYLRTEQAARSAAELRSARLELELLKRHIQPHFLLNTLTSLAEWVETEPRIGVRMIEALADEFRLLSRIAPKHTSEVRDEIALCRLHLQIMSLRHGTQLQLTTEGIHEERRLPPAILHTLIENALTHNRYPHGATFHLRERIEHRWRRYELACPRGATEPQVRAATQGTGLDYVRARLTEAFADRWKLTHGAGTDGGWITCIEVPA